ncbi:MAG TPA: SDR family NAD(P)-dependent oxidoreductase [Verrucomicrobiae bacterium]|nr:SDR family NAD(P)-dependent oxidoreductase [Verrucomicrobiae bacterium]
MSGGPGGPGTPAVYPDLSGKVAVITGGSRGIGAATAVALGANRAGVAVVGRDRAALDSTVTAITAEGATAIGLVADCTVEQDLAGLRTRVHRQLGAVDILVVFAGGSGMPVASHHETGQHWRQVIETNLTSTYLTIATFLPDMLARHSGVIVTMASAAARQAAGSSAAYAAAKAGVIGFSRHLAGEYAHAGIRINCIAPSAIETDRMRSWVPTEQRRALAAAFPLGRLGQPEDVAAATLFLASSASSWVTGATLDVAGGTVML